MKAFFKNHCPDHLVGLDTKLSSVVEPRLASLDVTLTGLEERVTKMEERADVINEVGRGLLTSAFTQSYS